MKRITSLLFVLALSACADDTRRSGDAAVLPDAPVIDSGPGVDGGPADGDMDGVVGVLDLCPSTAPGEPIDVNGCSTADTDNDGVRNDMDRCADTPADANVDGLGCQLEDQGTLDASWLVNGAPATAAACSAAGIVQVRLIVDRPGANFFMRDFPCGQAGFDGREDMTAPRLPRNQNFMNYWQALNSSGDVIAETISETLIISDVMHVTLPTVDFIIVAE